MSPERAEPEHTTIETIRVGSAELIERAKVLIHEGNVRRITVRQGDHIVVEFPLTVGVIAAIIAPVLAAIGAIAALITDCTLVVERVQETTKLPATPQTAEAPAMESAPEAAAETPEPAGIA